MVCYAPDFNPPRFSHLGLPEGLDVYTDAPHTIQHLNHNINQEEMVIPYDTRANILKNVMRVAACIANNGRHFKHIPVF